MMTIVYLKSSFNNTLFTITNELGKVLWWSSPALLGFKGCKRSTSLAAEALGFSVGERLIKEGRKDVVVRFKGFGSGRIAAIRGLRKTGIRILLLEDKTPVSHSRVRLSKKRRI